MIKTCIECQKEFDAKRSPRCVACRVANSKRYQEWYRSQPDKRQKKLDYLKQYNRTPENRAKDRARNNEPIRKVARKSYMKEYIANYRKIPENREKMKEYQRKYYSQEKVKKSKKLYRSNPVVKDKLRLNTELYRLKIRIQAVSQIIASEVSQLLATAR